MSPRNYMKINSPNKDGSINKNFISPRKNFEKNLLSNGMNPWYTEKERKVEELTSVLQNRASERLAVPRRVQAKWDDQVSGVKNIMNKFKHHSVNKSTDFSTD